MAKKETKKAVTNSQTVEEVKSDEVVVKPESIEQEVIADEPSEYEDVNVEEIVDEKVQQEPDAVDSQIPDVEHVPVIQEVMVKENDEIVDNVVNPVVKKVKLNLGRGFNFSWNGVSY